jgi:[ribosomal protein S5]-alanine N-acetyltransferase
LGQNCFIAYIKKINYQKMLTHLNTTRLSLQPLSLNDAAFVFELVNTQGWLQFIGNRHVSNLETSRHYIQKLMDNSNIQYWVVRLNENRIPMGIVTFIKRDYLEYHDIGFAFLPQYGNQGYAYEATRTVLNALKTEGHPKIWATTLEENVLSIKLLEKLGFHFAKTITVENTMLQLYGISS